MDYEDNDSADNNEDKDTNSYEDELEIENKHNLAPSDNTVGTTMSSRDIAMSNNSDSVIFSGNREPLASSNASNMKFRVLFSQFHKKINEIVRNQDLEIRNQDLEKYDDEIACFVEEK